MTGNRIPEAAGYDRVRETRPYRDGHGSYDVEHVTYDITLGGSTRPVRFTRIVQPDTSRGLANLTSDAVVLVKVGHGVKTYADSITLLDISHREPGMLAMAGFNALNRQAYFVGWRDVEQSNIRSGYGASYGRRGRKDG